MKDEQNKNPFELILMVVLISIFAMTFKCNAQPYINFSFDANKAFHLNDNGRTAKDIYGLDYDIEIGAREKHFGVYFFYGAFKNAGFINYGAGVDYYVNIFSKIDTSFGIAYSPTKQKDFRGLYEGVGMYSGRIVTTIWIKNIGLSLRGQLQNRTDVSKGYIFEGAIGLSFRL